MKNRINRMPYFVSALALSVACSMVGFAQAVVPPRQPSPPAMGKAMEDWRAKMLADWARAKEYTKEYLDAMPEDGTNYKPNAQDKDMRTFAEQMLHFTAANFMFASFEGVIGIHFNTKSHSKDFCFTRR